MFNLSQIKYVWMEMGRGSYESTRCAVKSRDSWLLFQARRDRCIPGKQKSLVWRGETLQQERSLWLMTCVHCKRTSERRLLYLVRRSWHSTSQLVFLEEMCVPVCMHACTNACISIQVYDKQRKMVLAQTTRHCNKLQAGRKTEIFPNALFFLLLSTPETMHSFIYFSCSPWHKPNRCRKQFPLGGSCTESWPVYSVLHITGQFFCFQQMLQNTAQIYCHFLVDFLCSFWGLVPVLYSKNLKSCIRWSDLFFFWANF